jgi:hypothetical protein
MTSSLAIDAGEGEKVVNPSRKLLIGNSCDKGENMLDAARYYNDVELARYRKDLV